MSRGFLMTISDGSYGGWYGDDGSINRVKYPEDEYEFVLDSDVDARVKRLRAEMLAPPPEQPPSALTNLIILAHKDSTSKEKLDAQARIDGDPKPIEVSINGN